MPIIRVEMFSGRTAEHKRAIAKELTEAFVRVGGGTPQAVTVLLHEIAKHDWATAGILVSDRLAESPS